MKVAIEDIKKLREVTGLSVIQCKRALAEAQGDLQEALEVLKQAGVALAKKKSERALLAGLIYAYVHNNGKVGTLLELSCETDFVARNDAFKKLAHELALQITSLNPSDVPDLLEQDYIKDPQQKISDLITAAVSKLGENIVVQKFSRFELGE